jgi:hypothetical protein
MFGPVCMYLGMLLKDGRLWSPNASLIGGLTSSNGVDVHALCSEFQLQLQLVFPGTVATWLHARCHNCLFAFVAVALINPLHMSMLLQEFQAGRVPSNLCQLCLSARGTAKACNRRPSTSYEGPVGSMCGPVCVCIWACFSRTAVCGAPMQA